MKSYLSLITISTKVRKRQNRMTVVCIILAVFLITAVFSMADMGIRAEKSHAIKNHGNWHIMLKNISTDDAEEIGARSDVAAASWYDAINYKIDEDFCLGGKKTAICGVEKALVTDIMDCLSDGAYPANDHEVILSDNAKEVLGVALDDPVTLHTPAGDFDCVVSGFTDDSATARIYDAFIVIMDISSFEKNFGRTDADRVYYVRFSDHINSRKAITDIKEKYKLNEENLSENTALLGITGFSLNSYMVGLYGIAVILFVLVLAAGALMIAGSIGSNVSERSQFFGMLRCVGAGRQQIIRLVRLEALNWCKTAIPAGIALGIVITWGICAVLHFMVGGEFAEFPLFKLSAAGIVSGIIVGILTVLFAAQAPAKRAARVSPVAAAAGCASDIKHMRHGLRSSDCRYISKVKIETALGIHHALSEKKNLILMTGSFALSIILFLCFSVMLDWVHHALNPLRPYAPELEIISNDRSCSIDRDLTAQIGTVSGVERVFGRMFRGGVPVVSDKGIDVIDLISYEEYQLNWAGSDVTDGDISKITKEENYVMTVYDKDNPLKLGDKIQALGAELTIACVLSDCPFDSDGTPTIICREETFTRLTGESDYAVIDVQLNGKAADRDVNAIRDMAGDAYRFSDRRESNREITGTYWAFTLLVYGFLAIIAMIAVFNIINSISMSVSARIRQYGVMRAVGMDGRQITGMIAAQAAAYAVCGSVAGCVLGLPLNIYLYEKMITDYWGDTWSVPLKPLIIILLAAFAATAAAVYAPSKRIRGMAITETISEL